MRRLTECGRSTSQREKRTGPAKLTVPPRRFTAGQPYVWTKTADDILTSIARFALRTADVHDRQNVMSRTTGTGH